MTRYSTGVPGALAAFLLLACGGTVSLREGGASGGGGTGNTAAAGGKPQLGDVGGATGASAPCVFGLAELCGAGGCPASAADLKDGCADSLVFVSAATDCGGTVVIDGSGFVARSWYFDATGVLTGSVFSSDVPETCANGSSYEVVHGTTCALAEETTDACLPPEGCEPAPLTCGARQDCPASADEVLARYCGSPSTLGVTSTATTCGGSLLLVQNSAEDLRYCFDRQGQLIGSLSRDAATGVETRHGSRCIESGTATYACGDDTQ